MELLALAAVGLLLGIPAAAFYAVYRVSVLGSEVGRLREEIVKLRRTVRPGSPPTPQPTPRAATATPPVSASRTRPAGYQATDERTGREEGWAPEGTPGPAATTPEGAVPTSESATPEPAAPRSEPAASTPEGAAPTSEGKAPEAAAHSPGATPDAAPAPPPRPEREPASTAGAPDGARAREAAPDEAAVDDAADETDAPRADEPRPRQPQEAGATVDSGLDLETLIGSTWLLRVGLGILAIALALFARSVAPVLPPIAKVALAYAGALAFFGVGRFFEEKLERFARPVMAGGLAFGFFVAYAAYFVPAMQAVSLPISIVWMLLSMLAVLVAAERWDSEPTAILAIVLGHIAAQVSAGQGDAYSLVMIGFLGVTAIVMLLRHHWVTLGLLGVVGSYGAHLLWLLADGQPPQGNAGFWLSLAFLTSYYVIFLVADILWWLRRSGSEETPEATLNSARALGPSNLVLYVSVTTVVYFVSGASVESIEWYFLTLGTLQGALTWLYYGADHEDYVFYPVFGTVLWTLGMFAALDALALNLVLSAQALILLLAAHRTGLTVFYWLAQAAMAVAFVHFMVVPPPATPTLGAFLGGLGVAVVYYVKACLEEDWYRVHALVAPVHAALGSIVLLTHATAYFRGDPRLGLFLVAALVALLGAVAARRRPAILFSVTTLAVALPLLTATYPATTMLLPSIGFALGALALTWLIPARFEDADRLSGNRQTQAIVVAVLGAVMFSGGGLTGSLLEYLAWMSVPVVLLAAQSRLSGNDTNPTLPTVVHLAIALAVIVLTEASIDVAMLKPVWIAGWAALAMIAAGVLRSRGFAETGYGILFGGYLYFLSVDLASASIRASGSVHPSFESWWAGALVALVPLLIGIGVDRHTTLEASEEGTAGPEGGTPGSQEGTAGGKDPEAPHGDTGPPSRFRGLAPPFAPSLLGLLLLGVYANAQLPAGFGYLVPAVVSLLLLHLADAFPARRLVIAAVAAVGALHIFFLSEGYIGTNIETAGIALLLFVVATLAVERGAQPRMSENPADTAVATPALMALVVLATATSMTAIYLWVFVGPTWATAGWSVVGGSILAAGFVFRASIYRRVGLVVLGVCIVRVFAVDTVGLSDTARIGAFLVLGLILVGIALLYTRYTAELKEWL